MASAVDAFQTRGTPLAGRPVRAAGPVRRRLTCVMLVTATRARSAVAHALAGVAATLADKTWLALRAAFAARVRCRGLAYVVGVAAPVRTSARIAGARSGWIAGVAALAGISFV